MAAFAALSPEPPLNLAGTSGPTASASKIGGSIVARGFISSGTGARRASKDAFLPTGSGVVTGGMAAGCLATTGIASSVAGGRAPESWLPGAKALATPAVVVTSASARNPRFFICRLPLQNRSPLVATALTTEMWCRRCRLQIPWAPIADELRHFPHRSTVRRVPLLCRFLPTLLAGGLLG